MKKLDTLYARTKSGAIQEWTVIIDGPEYYTVYGQTDGKKITSARTRAIPTNEGKSNERDEEKQALFEAKREWKKKKEEGYFENIKDIDKPRWLEPMRAQHYKDAVKRGLIKFNEGVWVQDKMDGIRSNVRKDGIWSRQGKPFVSCPHIYEYFQDVIVKRFPGIVLDGELYCDIYKNDFDKICSLIKKKKPNAEEIEETRKFVQLWVYDVPSLDGVPYQERLEFIEDELAPTFNEFFVPVKTLKVNNQKEMDAHYEDALERMMEGQINRLNGVYEWERAWSLIKRKEFTDKEYTILDITAGVGIKADMAARVHIKTEKGIDVYPSIKMSHEKCRWLLKNKNKIIGKEGTVRFGNETPEGSLRFPRLVAIRDYE
jgi:DNA ligase-1